MMASNVDTIRALVEEIFEASRHGEGCNSYKMYDRQEHMLSYGSEIVDVILDDLAERKSLGKIQYNDADALTILILCLRNYPLRNYAGKITSLTEKRHAGKIAFLLCWDEIASYGDHRSMRCSLLNILKEIGGSAEIKILEKFAELVKSAEYRTNDVNDNTYQWNGREYVLFGKRESGLERVLRFRQLDQDDIRKTIDVIKSRVS